MIPQFTQIQVRVLKDKRVKPRMRDVMMLLQSMMNEQGVCWPSFNYIAGCLGVTRRTVINIVNELVDLGYVIKMKRTVDGTAEQTSNYYAINNNFDAGLELRKKRGEKLTHKPVDKSNFGVKKISPPPSEKNFTPNQVNIFLNKGARTCTREKDAHKMDVSGVQSDVVLDGAFVLENARQKKGVEVTGVDKTLWKEVKNRLFEWDFREFQGVEIVKTAPLTYTLKPSFDVMKMPDENIVNEAIRDVLPKAKIKINSVDYATEISGSVVLV